MTTRNIVPRATGEGGIGTSLKKWLAGYFSNIYINSINPSGENVGIGTTTPGNIFHVYKNVHESYSVLGQFMNVGLTSGDSAQLKFGFNTSASNAGELAFVYSGSGSAANMVSIGVVGSPNIFNIRSDGNVGIGTTTPGAILHLLSSNGALRQEFSGTTAIDQIPYGAGYSLVGPSGNWKSVAWKAVGVSDLFGIAIDGTAHLGQIYGLLNSTHVKPITFDSFGNVGIGTTSPSSKLSVSGNLSVGANYAAVAAPTSGAIFEGKVGFGISNVTTICAAEFGSIQMTGQWSQFRIVDPVTGPTSGGSFRFGPSGTGGISWQQNTAVAGDFTTAAPIMYFSSGALIGFGSTSPASKVSVLGNLSVGSTYAAIAAPTNGAIFEGKVGIATTSPSEVLHVVGNIRNSALAGTGNRAVYSTEYGNLTNSSSDRLLKTNITNINYGLAQVMQMRPVSFNWKQPAILGSQKEIGFIAQEIEEIIPEVIAMNADGMRSLDYPKLIAVMAKAIQELNDKLEAHLNV